MTLLKIRWLPPTSFLRGEPCSNPRSSWVTYVTLSNVYNFSPLFNTHPLLFYQTFVIFSTFLIYSLFCVIYTSYKCTCCTHHKHNSFCRLIVCTLSAPIYLSNSPGIFGHPAILTMGGSDRGQGLPHRTNSYVSASKNRKIWVCSIHLPAAGQDANPNNHI